MVGIETSIPCPDTQNPDTSRRSGELERHNMLPSSPDSLLGSFLILGSSLLARLPLWRTLLPENDWEPVGWQSSEISHLLCAPETELMWTVHFVTRLPRKLPTSFGGIRYDLWHISFHFFGWPQKLILYPWTAQASNFHGAFVIFIFNSERKIVKKSLICRWRDKGFRDVQADCHVELVLVLDRWVADSCFGTPGTGD